MNCIILAAGYATRLYPLTENFPKPLLKVGDRTIMDHLADDLDSTGMVDSITVVTNHRFAGHFRDWAATRRGNVAVVDDGTSTNETRLGALRDIILAAESAPCGDFTLVLAGDNLLDFSLKSFMEYALAKGTSCVMRHFEPEKKKLSKTGVLEIDDEDRIVAMQEKPAEPRSNWACPPFYCYRKEDLLRMREAVEGGCGADAPGSYVTWLSSRAPVHAMLMPGRRYDIGDLESYNTVQKEYKGIL